MNVTKFKVETGEIIGILQCPDTELAANIYEGEDYIDGEIDASQFYIVERKPVPMPTKPGEHYAFDFNTKQWKVSEEAPYLIRYERSEKLKETDWTDTLSAKNRLGDDLYNAWQEYRQALRDITDQPGFPENVVWPEPPQ